MRNVARLVAAGTTSLLLIGLVPGVALAAGSITVQSPSPARHFNDASAFDLVLQATGPYLPSGSVSVKLVGGPGGDTKTFSGTATGATTVTASGITVQGMNIGSYGLQTLVGGNVVDQCAACFTVDGYSPSVSGVSPATVAAGSSSDSTGPGFNGFTISGQGFTDGPYTQCTGAVSGCAGLSVALVPTGQTTAVSDITLTATTTPTAATPTSIVLRMNVPRTATTGDYDVVVVNAPGKSATCSACFHVLPALTASSVALALPGTSDTLGHIGKNATGQTLRVTGQNLPSDTAVAFSNPGTSPGSITFASSSAPATAGPNQVVTVTGVDTTQVSALGSWNVTLSSPSLHATSAPATLSVVAAPSATSGAGTFGQGAQGVSAVANGSGLESETVNGTTYATHLALVSRPPGLVLGAPVVAATNGTGTVTTPVTVAHSTPTGGYAFKLVNPDGGTSAACDNSSQVPPASNTCLLSVTTGPSLSSISPATLASGAQGRAVTLTGSGFHPGGVTVTIGGAGSGITATVGTVTATSVALTVSVPSSTPVSDLDVVLKNNDDSGQDKLPAALHVASLSVDGVSPSSWTNDTVKTLTLSGTNLSAAQTSDVRLVKTGVPAVVGTAITSVGTTDTGVSASFDLRGIAPGAYDVQATNGTGSHLGTAACAGCFTVQAPAPTITGVSPSTLGGGASHESVVVTGTNIFPGASLAFSSSKVTPVGSPVVDRVAGTITQVVSVAGDATAATGTVTVTNTDGQSAGSGFSTAPAPTVSGVSPTQKASGTTFAFTVTGSGFTASPPPTLSFDVPGVTTTTVTVATGGSQLTTTVTLPAGAATTSPVQMHVVVVNGDRGRATSPVAVTVTPQPVVSSISTGRADPTTAPAGQSVPLQVTGQAFQSGLTIAPQATGSGLTVSGVSFVSATAATATVAVDGAATAGPRTLVLSNPDGGATTFVLSVITKPTAPQNVVATPGVRTATVTWDAPAGGSAPSTYLVTLTSTTPGGANPQPVSVLSPRSASFSGLASGTTYDVSVVASNDAGSSPAAVGTVTTFTTPGAPTALSLTGGAHQIAATWAAPASDGGSPVTSYTVRATSTSNPSDTVTSPQLSGTSYTVPGLTSGTQYRVTVVATSAVGDSPAATGTATTSAVPGAPTAVAAEPGLRQLTVSWSAPASDLPVSSYRVTAVNTADGADAHDSGTLADTARSFLVTGLRDGATYAVSVRATSAAGDSAAATVSRTTFAAPGAPVGVTVRRGDHALTVTFSAPASDGGTPVRSYTVSATPGPVSISVSAAGPVTLTGLTNGTAYSVVVTASNDVGRGAASTPVTEVPLGVTTTALNALPSRVVYGSYVTLAGVVHRTDGTAPFEVVGVFTRTDAGLVREVAEVPVSSAGAWSYRVRPGINLQYLAVYFGDATNDGSSSVVRRVLVAVKISASSATGSHRVNAVVAGGVAPNKAGRTAYLYRVTSTGSLVRLAAARISSTSHYAFSVRLPAGRTRLRVYVYASPNNAAGVTSLTATRT